MGVAPDLWDLDSRGKAFGCLQSPIALRRAASEVTLRLWGVSLGLVVNVCNETQQEDHANRNGTTFQQVLT